MRSTVSSPLLQWWWPGQWLRLVYAVWVDQRWYWEQVRPLLDQPRRRWLLTAQALIGAALVVALINVGMHMALDWLLDRTFNQPLTARFALNAALGFGGALIASAVWRMTLSGTVTLSIPASVLCTILPFLASDNPVLVVIVLALALVSGVAFGIARVVATGNNWQAIEPGALAVLIAIDAVADGRVVQGLLQASLCLVGSYLGARWAARQVPDLDLRKQFAAVSKSRFSPS